MSTQSAETFILKSDPMSKMRVRDIFSFYDLQVIFSKGRTNRPNWTLVVGDDIYKLNMKTDSSQSWSVFEEHAFDITGNVKWYLRFEPVRTRLSKSFLTLSEVKMENVNGIHKVDIFNKDVSIVFQP